MFNAISSFNAEIPKIKEIQKTDLQFFLKLMATQQGEKIKSFPQFSEIANDMFKNLVFRYFEAENTPIIKHDRPGLLSMINNGSGKYGSQVYIFFL